MPKNAEKYRCEKCNFSCSKKSNYTAHLLTAKHKMINDDNEKMPKNAAPIYQCDCGKPYKHMSGLSRHKKICTFISGNNNETNEFTKPLEMEKEEKEKKEENSTDYKDLLIKAMMQMQEKDNLVCEAMKENTEMRKEMTEMRKQMTDMIPLIGNNNNNTTNNQFNLQFYLNETCKDALNLTDFINSLQVQLKDLEYTADNGHVKGITNIFHTALSNIEETKRPMHCTDLKREVLYIKDNDEWHKDENKEEIKVAVNKVVNKNIGNQGKWIDAHPNLDKEEEMEKYIKMQDHSLGTGEEAEKNKIVKNILKEVTITK